MAAQGYREVFSHCLERSCEFYSTLFTHSPVLHLLFRLFPSLLDYDKCTLIINLLIMDVVLVKTLRNN